MQLNMPNQIKLTVIFQLIFKTVFVLLGFTAFTGQAHAGLELQTSYYLSQDTEIPSAEVLAKKFKPFTGVLNLGFTHKVVWVRVKVGGLKTDERHFLSFRPNSIEALQFYEVLATDADTPVFLPVTNRAKNSETRTISTYRPGVLLPAGIEKTEYLVRLQSDGLILAYLEVQDDYDYLKDLAFAAIRAGLFFGMSLTLLGFVIVVGGGSSSKFYGLFLLFQTALISLVLSMNNIFSPLLQTLGMNVFVIFKWFFPLAIAETAIFTMALLKFLHVNAYVQRAQYYMFAIFVIALMGQASLGVNNFSRLAIVYLLILCAMAIAALSFARIKYLFYKILIIASFSMLAVVGLLGMLTSLFQVSLGTLIFQWPLMLVASLSVLMFITVMYEIYVIRADQREIKTQLALEQQKLEIEYENNLQSSKLLSMLSHEFKNSLAIVTMELSMLAEQGIELKYASNAISDLLAIIERCMLLEKSGQDRISVNVEPVDCHEVLKSATISNFGKNSIHVECPENLFVFSDQNILRVIVTNLVDNACKYGAKNKTITVTAKEIEGDEFERIELSVSNHVGPYGRPDRSLMFSKYYRSPSVASVSGSGLGLYLIDTLAHLIDAKVLYDDSQTDIVCFRIALSRANSEI